MRGEEMSRRKYTTTLDDKTIKALNIIKSINNLNGTNDVIELLVREHIENNNLGGVLNEPVTIKKD
jgi:hypothetical protein